MKSAIISETDFARYSKLRGWLLIFILLNFAMILFLGVLLVFSLGTGIYYNIATQSAAGMIQASPIIIFTVPNIISILICTILIISRKKAGRIIYAIITCCLLGLVLILRTTSLLSNVLAIFILGLIYLFSSKHVKVYLGIITKDNVIAQENSENETENISNT